MASAKEPEQLGRLFFTPVERSNFNTLRQNSKAPDKVIKAEEIKDDEVTVENSPSALKPVIMNGYIKRSDGKNTVWINDREISGSGTIKDVSVGRLNNNRITVTLNNNKSASLRPGQVYDPNTGKIYNHLSEMPRPVGVEDAEPESAVDKVSKVLGLDDFKKKAIDFIDALSSKPNATAPSDSTQ
jgi:hypothetical protein